MKIGKFDLKAVRDTENLLGKVDYSMSEKERQVVKQNKF